MILRKITIDNSVKCIRITEKTKKTDNIPKKTKAASLPRKQNKNISQNDIKILKKISAKGFKYLK